MQSPTVRSAITTVTNARPIAAARPMRGATPASPPTPSAIASSPAVRPKARLSSPNLTARAAARGSRVVRHKQLQVLPVRLRRHERVLEIDGLEQDAARPVRGLDTEGLGDRRAAKVRLDQDHLVAGESEGGGEVDRRRRLPLR